ncbi:retention module-containing protein [Pseudomonas sp. TWR3-1-1]|uniref:retention module-containing protein n=1 Tax=Pseudomonas sp. TWR3-1-1 TaxID=2804633 RepID=UPI003CE8308D
MASLIGVVSNVVGQVVAIASDGSRRVLIEGDRVFAGEQLETGTAGAVAIHLQGGGGELTMGRESTMTLSSALLSPNPASHVDSPETLTPSEAQLTDVEKLQAAIAAGEDPTQVAEATAAGPAATGAPGGQVGGGHTFVLLEEVAGRVDPIIGFPTAGFNGIPEFVEERVIGLRDDDDGAFVPPPVVVPPDNPVTLTGLSVEGGELTLSEASLALGSASNPAALTQSGTFSVSAPDGLLTLNVGGITVVNGSVASGVGQSITTGLGNTLTITGYNPTTGVVSYSYTLNGNDTHPAGQGANSLSEHFSVIATDSNGSTATNSLDINVVDDVPTAVNDSNAGVASETQLTLSGSVLTNDSQGADRVATGPVTAGTFTGTYGTLTLAADGTYTYTLNPQDADFLALKGGGNGTETFSYTLTDSDGDSSTANLVLNIHNNDDTVSIVPGINGNLTPLNEAHLPTGSAPDAAALTQQGSFTINAPDGLQSLSVGGINVISGGVVSGVGQSITTGLNNTLTVTGYDATTGIVTYTYTLNGNDSHAAGNGANVLGEQFSVIATDTNGTTGTSTLIANVIDDVPTAVNDNNDGIASESNLQLTGNVLTNDVQGADRVGAGPITAGTFTGTYGTLVLATDGTYTYTVHSTDPAFLALKGGGNGTDTFTYTLTDSDGDASTAQLVLNVHNNNDPVVLTGLDVGGGELTLYESNLPAGSTPVDAKGPLTQSGTFTVTSLDGLQNLSVGGIDIIKDGVINTGVQTISTGLNNTFTVNGYNPVTGVVSYSYTLTGADQHPAGDGTNSVSEQFAVVATDVDGSTATGTVDVNIVDDVPSAANDTGGLIEGGTSTLNVLTNDVLGADGATVVAIKAGSNAAVTVTSGGSTVINGTYGTLTISADGTAVYKGTPNLVTTPTATDTFTYTIRDGDGDQSTATVTFTLTDSGLKVVSDAQATVFENALDQTQDGLDLAPGSVTGSAPDSTAETVTGNLTANTSGGSGALTFVLLSNTAGAYGQIQLNANGQYTYTLTSAPKTTPGADNGANTVAGLENFTYQATDALGNTTTGTIKISIVDDVPQATNDTGTLIEGGTSTLNVLANDVLGADGGAAGGAVVAIKAGSNAAVTVTSGGSTVINGTYGTLTISADGTAVYKGTPNLVTTPTATDTFTYTIRDGDGDQSTATVTFTLTDSGLKVVSDAQATVFENALDLVKDGADLAQGTVTGSTPASTAETVTGNLTANTSGGSGALTFVLLSNTAGAYGQIQLNANGQYTYTLSSAPKTTPGADNGANTVAGLENFTYQATDALGNTTTGTIKISIVDDVPQATNDTGTLIEGGTSTLNVLANDVLGADGGAAGGAVVAIKAGSNAAVTVTSGGSTVINGTYGTLTISADGTAVYKGTPNLVTTPTATDTFTYTIRDGDGDQSTATVTFTLTDSGLKVVSDAQATVFENALDLVKDGADLAQGTVTGSTPASTAETVTGNLTANTSGGSGAVTFVLLSNTAGAYGQIQLNANGQYTYTLTSAPKTTPGADNGANVIDGQESFTYQATDALGNTTTGTIKISIVDDVPLATNDTGTLIEGGTSTLNVLANDVLGADGGAAGGAVVAIKAGSNAAVTVTSGGSTVINGTYGTLTISADGTAVYKGTPNLVTTPTATDTFTYTIRDGDGDQSTATVTFTLTDSGLKVVSDAQATVFENALDLVKDGADLAQGTVTGSTPASTAETVTGNLTANTSGGSGAVTFALLGSTTGAYGQIQLNANGQYTYTLTSAPKTTPGADNGANTVAGLENFTYQATDALGNTTTGTIKISIVDDVPQATNDTGTLIEGGTSTLNVLANDVLGADGGAAGGAVVAIKAGSNAAVTVTSGGSTVINGTYGTLTISADGTAVYKGTPNLVTTPTATDTFTYTIRDGDGDQSTATVTFTLTDSGLKVVSDAQATVFENALDLVKDGADLAQGTVTGSTPASTAETVTGNLTANTSGGSGALTFVLLSNTAGAYGQIQLNANGQYTYTLTSAPKTTPGADNGANTVAGLENFTYQATDALGNTTTGTIKISIVDDVPQATNDTGTLIEGGTSTLNVLANDILGADGGAAGGAVVAIKAGSNAAVTVTSGGSTVINGTYGTLTISADGTAVYKGTPNLVTTPTATDTFTYTIRDGDGDQSTATVTFNLTDSGLKVTSASQTTVFENALDLVKDGADLAQGTVTGSTPASTAETATGDLTTTTTGGVGPLTFTLQGSTTGTYGVLQLGSDGKYTYTLTSAPKTTPNANDGPNTVVGETFNYQAKDSLGNTTTGTIQINIVDDVPKAVAAERSVTTVKVDSNLLLTIDVSGSMGDPSGVPGLNRLQLAKQAINALLDKYAGMGDVLVQVVAFSSSATNVSGGWVTVAQAKAFVGSLTAGGGTNYDGAVATSQTAFNSSGKLTGAQNVGYFFSDGAPTAGQNISASDEVALKAFLDANSIKNYAIGLGTGVSNANLNPLAYDGSTHTDTNAVVVTDLSQLNSVLAGTVIAPTVTGTLLEGGSFGADGGFIKSITVDGATYTYDPKASNGAGGLTFTGTVNHGTFNTVDNTLTIATNSGANLVINLDTGAYSYTPQTVAATPFNETIGFVVSDNDGDLAGSSVVIHVNPNVAPVAGNDNIITNILAPTIAVPGDVLLANDTDANGDPLSATPTTFTTLWGAKGAGFTSTTGTLPTGTFNATANALANQQLTVDRSSFKINTSTMTAALLVSGYLGAVTNAAANPNAEDVISVSLKQGETLNLDHNLLAGRIGMEYSFNGGAYTAIADGGTFTAGQTGTYQIHITNITNPDNSNAAETYNLNMTIGYANTTVSPNFSGSYIASDSHGGSDSGGVTLTYQAGTSLTGTAGDDVMLVAAGNNTVHGGDGNDVLSGTTGNNNFYGDAGNDLLFSGSGNDLLDGGTGNDTASYAHSAAGVTVTLASTAQQNTVGAGLDTLVSIENLTGSNFNDVLTGDGNANVINGGLGNDTLNGGGGDDILIGGMGNNTLTGGTGNDTFLYQQGNTGRDTVTDFTFGSDKLDLSQLLQGENATAASLDDYLHFKVTGSGATLVSSIDISAVAGATPTQTIDLAGVNLATQYGVTPGAGGLIAGGADTATIINGMLNDHSLKVDTV